MTATLQDRAAKARADLHEALAQVHPPLARPQRARPHRLVLTAAALVALIGLIGLVLVGRPGPQRAGRSVRTDGKLISVPAAGLAFSVPAEWTVTNPTPNSGITVASLHGPGNASLAVQAVALGEASAQALAGQIAANLTVGHVTSSIASDATVAPGGRRMEWDYVGGHVTAYVFIDHGVGVTFFFRNLPADQALAILSTYRSTPRPAPGWSRVNAQGVSLQVPRQWVAQDPSLPTAFGPVGKVGYLVQGVTGLAAITFLPTPGVDGTHAAASLQQMLAPLGARNFRTTTVTVANTPVVEMDYTSATQLGRPVGFPLVQRDYFLPRQGHLVQVHLLGPDTDETRATFDAIARTITID